MKQSQNDYFVSLLKNLVNALGTNDLNVVAGLLADGHNTAQAMLSEEKSRVHSERVKMGIRASKARKA